MRGVLLGAAERQDSQRMRARRARKLRGCHLRPKHAGAKCYSRER
jgi:hypothetical protein